jgi:class 3 adenylate cyclase
MYQNSGNILFISGEEHELHQFRSEFVRLYNVFTASSIREGYKILQEYDVHVVLVKQFMKEMTGMQFCESISHSFPETMKIILNENSDTDSLDRAVQSNMIFRYVQSPYRIEDLRMTLDGALKLSEAEYKNRELSKMLDQYRDDQEHILRLFKKYVPAEVVSQALRAKDHNHIQAGESRVVSILFADIRGFTQFASRLRPSQVVEFLNDYWAEISECVKKNKGSVNKYMGDGLLAIFGAPVSHIDNHENAVAAALDMVEKLDEINARYSEILGTEIKIGIGINSGEVVVGNIGTDNYMEYTVIGDAVNMASRMEAISKQIPNSIVISEKTHDLVKHAFETSDLKQGTITDKDQTVSYYEVLGKKPGNVYNIRSSKNS